MLISFEPLRPFRRLASTAPSGVVLLASWDRRFRTPRCQRPGFQRLPGPHRPPSPVIRRHRPQSGNPGPVAGGCEPDSQSYAATRDKLLSTKAGIHRHYEHVIHHIENFRERLHRRCRIKDDSYLSPWSRICSSVRFKWRVASWCTEIQFAPASTNAGIYSSGFSIIK